MGRLFRRRGVSLLLCLTLGACAGARPPRTPATSEPVPAPAHALAQTLNGLIESPAARPAVWGVLVRSLDSGEVLFDHHGDRLLMPASTMKLVALAVAAERLGWDHRYGTELLSTGPIVDGTLDGDLLVRGGGDPTINAGGGRETPVFDDWADALLGTGITTITGRVVGDDDLVEEAAPGFGWSWDDLPHGYAAAGGALIHRGNTARLTVHSGSVAGEDTLIEIDPPAVGPLVVNHVETSGPDAEPDLELRRAHDGALEVRGGIPASASPISLSAAVADPTLFFVRELTRALERAGIAVTGEAVDLDNLDVPISDDTPALLVRHRSPPLSEIAVPLMRNSQNLYAEALLRTLDQGRRPRTAAAGRNIMREMLESWDIGPSRIVVADASGLSRYNYVTARALVDVLQRMYDHPRHAEPYLAALPVAGESGTLASRMSGTAAAGNARAKTGSMSNVRALAGYVTSADGEMLAFAVLANNFSGAAGPILGIIDRMVGQLARTTRPASGR